MKLAGELGTHRLELVASGDATLRLAAREIDANAGFDVVVRMMEEAQGRARRVERRPAPRELEPPEVLIERKGRRILRPHAMREPHEHDGVRTDAGEQA